MRTLELDHRLTPFVKELMLLEGGAEACETCLPFYADGYPGIMYAETCTGITRHPHAKALGEFILYGQTIEPIELRMVGPYKLIVHQLYPFATRLLMGLDPRSLNDGCADLTRLDLGLAAPRHVTLRGLPTDQQVAGITRFLLALVARAAEDPDTTIKMAITTIISTRGTISVTALREQLHISERTFERKFLREIGVTPKQFARIVQFSFSLHQLKGSDYTTLTNVAYDNGFADQSHFIRTFKKYTGCTPRELLTSMR